MSSLVDTFEVGREELQEDEELIEAVEELIETAAVSIWSGIVEDFHDLVTKLQEWKFYLLPFLVAYQEDTSRFGQDLGRLALYLGLFGVAFVVLAPFSSWNKSSSSKLNNGFGSLSSSGTGGNSRHHNLFRTAFDSTPSTPRSEGSETQSDSLLEKDETDEERFKQLWPKSISLSNYSRLVLPPECRRVQPSEQQQRRTALLQQLQQATAVAQQQQKQEEWDESHRNFGIGCDDDNPAKRLQIYVQHFLVLIRSLLSFDYVGVGRTIMSWLQGIRQYRRTHSDLAAVSPTENVPEQQPQQPDAPEQQQPNRICEKSGDAASTEGSYYSTEITENGRNSDTTLNVANTTDLRKHDLSTSPFGTPQQGRGHMRYLDAADNEEKKEAASTPQLPVPLIPVQNEDSIFRTSIYFDTMGDYQSDVSKASSSPKKCRENPILLVQQKRLYIGGVKAKDLLRSYEPTSNRDLVLNRASNSSQSAGQALMADTRPPVQFANVVCDDVDSKATSPDQGTQPYFFETATSRLSLMKMAVEVPVPDKNGYIVGDEFLPNSQFTPLLVFVNSRSGPQQGHLLITQLRRLLNPIQVWDLADGGPEAILESFCTLTRLRILVCGGDGTVSWIISALEKMKLQRKWPPIAILPLGTGNDLARVHGWGGGYNNESLIGILEQISESYISMLDRWEVTIEDEKKNREVENFLNYLGVGADAQAALQVHYLRESRPDWFFSRMVNKAWYGIFGAEDIIKASSVHVRKNIKLFADGVEIPLPHDSQGIILLNIDAYAGGVPLWSHGVKVDKRDEQSDVFSSTMRPLSRSQSLSQVLESIGPLRRSNSLDSTDDSLQQKYSTNSRDDRIQNLSAEERFAAVTSCSRPSSCQDGLLDVVSIRGAFHLGQIKVGLSNAQRLCQCREVKIVLKNRLAVQIDGEPWRQRPCTLNIRRKMDLGGNEYTQVAMLHRSADDGGVETEMSKLLDWAEERQLIDGQVHSVLMKEFSRRIESKIRQRRQGRSAKTGDIMSTLKKAISSNAVSNLGGGQSSSVWGQGGGGPL